MLQSLATTEYPSGYFDSFGHIIIDECHRVSTTVFSSIFFKINSNYMLGLSATPERKDNMTKVIKWHIGDIIKLDIVKYKINIDVKRFVLNCEKEALLKNNECIFSNKITKLLENEIRNKIIVKTVLDELKNCPDRHFLVLSDRVDHLKKLYQIFRQNKMTSVGLFIGEMDKDALKLSTGCKVILGSYSMANEGLDIPTLNCLVLASPKIEVFQTIGRISRLQENDKYIKPLIIDFIDILQVFIKEAEKRLTLYKKSNYEISDYLYNEKTNIFEKNLSKNTDYNIYLLGETVSHHKIMKKDMIDDLFGQFSHHKTI
jgi:superfamily II DNA or RNA helicase